MRFINFLNEDVSNNIDIIKKNCKPYINKFSDLFLYRGFKSSENFFKIETNRNRKPIDMTEEASDLINRAFMAGFKKPLRSMTAFASSDINQINGYGKEFYFFPKGKFEVYWSPEIKDLYFNYYEFLHDPKLIAFSLLFLFYKMEYLKCSVLFGRFEEWIKKNFYIPESFNYKSKKDLEKLIEQLENYKKLNEEFKYFCKKYYIKGNLQQSIRSRNEVMVDCDEYYLLLREDISENELLNKLKEI